MSSLADVAPRPAAVSRAGHPRSETGRDVACRGVDGAQAGPLVERNGNFKHGRYMRETKEFAHAPDDT